GRMIDGGLLEEVKRLLDRGLRQEILRANVIGYNETIEHLTGNLSLPDAVSSIKQNSRRYAKRQLTWFRRLSEDDHFQDAGDLIKAVSSLCELWAQ
ncbi:MAG: tRNA dimethylallyltransferase, partial [candidate division Zixibacteria bacterium]